MQYDNLFKSYLRERIRVAKLVDELAKFTVLDSRFVKLPSNEYALMKGKEVIVNCEIRGCYGQAFTDKPTECKVKIDRILDLNLDDTGNRALFFSALNAVMRFLVEIDGVVHCRENEAERCGHMMASKILEEHGKVRVAHIGYQPGHVSALSKTFDEVYVTDLNPENISKEKFGIKILDGSENEDVISSVDVACITGSSLINGTLFDLLRFCEKYNTHCLLYGITVKGAGKILGYEVFCPLAHNSLKNENNK